ncbi:MAG: methylated-DNA--[protein]-cysteine S-methyltransferase [Candidatus Methanoperedens sp.]|nr:methylated-DNA--[protein]-cysteine S-methyltransferase [Candidatus Methanoperedens sp.]MCZ7395890.1 methylated-DNA--[protein]-cysteine S-methyltransferase [Candidatus Methanoperedens sp.]
MTEFIDIIFAKPIECYVEIDYKKKLRSIRFLKSKENLKERKTLDISFELERYFNGEEIDFSCELDISHLSPFAQKVLEETTKIGYGETITYSELARNIGSKGARAAGRALAINPLPIVIPCHRVVAKNGIGGYSAGVDIKTRLLELEKIQ